jgi:hypothetical protein
VNPRVFVDFGNTDPQGRVRLNCAGTDESLKKQRIELREGLNLLLYSDDSDEQGRLDDLLVDGVAAYSKEEQIWVAIIDWSAIHHASDDKKTTFKKVI